MFKVERASSEFCVRDCWLAHSMHVKSLPTPAFFAEGTMNWMLLPPDANVGRYLDDRTLSRDDVWALLARAALRLIRQVVAATHR
jgi:hypothetical protein